MAWSLRKQDVHSMNWLDNSDLSPKFGKDLSRWLRFPESPPNEWKKMTLLGWSEKQKTSNSLRIRGFDSL